MAMKTRVKLRERSNIYLKSRIILFENCSKEIKSNIRVYVYVNYERAVTVIFSRGEGNNGVDSPQDLQLALNIRGSVLLSTLLHGPDAPSRSIR